MIDITNLTLQIGTRVLLDKASVHIADGQKVGIVGENGCGKSTLFRAILNACKNSDGDINNEIQLPLSAKIAYVEQTIGDTALAVMEYVLSKDTELMNLRRLAENPNTPDLAEVHERLKMLDSDGAEGKIAQILDGLGFSNEDLTRPVSDFSGGWRMRLSLAGALFRYSDILLLDEPTNHLDLEASVWLESHLKKYRGTLLLISHDRMLLNDLCDTILHFDSQKLILYRGNYDTFEETRNITRAQQVAQSAKIAEKRAHLQAYVDRFRYKASKAKQAQSRLKMLEKLKDVAVLGAESHDHFTFPTPERLAPPLISLDDVSTGYGEHIVLRKLTLSIGLNERIALLGKNGNGKSTFAKLLDGKLPAFTGKINRLSRLKIGYFAQHQEEDLPLDETPLSYFQPMMSDSTPTAVRSYLATFGINNDKALTAIKYLSGGEKARLIFARIAREKPALLILDEPTNHLDMKGREALLEALNQFEGSVLLITHDFHLIELFADELWLIDKERCLPYQGDLSDYREFLLNKNEQFAQKQKKSTTLAPKTNQSSDATAGAGASASQKSSGTVQAVTRLSAVQVRQIKAKMGQAERILSELTAQQHLLQQKFETPLSGAEILQIQNELKEIENKIAEQEEIWLNLSERLG